jgi:hypothetical protein
MMKASELAYGRPESEWDELEDACLDFLVERARAGLTNYTDLNRELVRRTGLAAFDFGQAADRAALWAEAVTQGNFRSTLVSTACADRLRAADGPADCTASVACAHRRRP